ncbi:hypothetical protein G9A89_022598 [Geosiphon pyriformis]|nr:hypothetical protein G9A89_022598 [Geosiphon pyriformis]
MQYALNIASEFFSINDISINNEKTVIIPINQGVKFAALSINGQPISMAGKGKTYKYLGIFLSTERLFKLNLVRAYADVYFFVNVVLRKTIIDKQFSYLMLAVLQPIGCVMDWKTFHWWKRLDFKGSVPYWFDVTSRFLYSNSFSPLVLSVSLQADGLNILNSNEFAKVQDSLHKIWSGLFEVYSDGSLRNTGPDDVVSDTVAYFLALDMSINVGVHGFAFFTMAELQAVTLSLECVPSSCFLIVYLNSQTAIDAYVLEVALAVSDFYNQCWIEKRNIYNLIKDKDLTVSWVKVKSHSEIYGNIRVDAAVGVAAGSLYYLPMGVHKHFLMAENTAVFGNAYHFVRDIFQSVCCAQWEVGLGRNMVPSLLIMEINWDFTAKIWHSDSHLLAGFTKYPSMLCLLCSKVELPNHVFTCGQDTGICDKILAEASTHWAALADLCCCVQRVCA